MTASSWSRSRARATPTAPPMGPGAPIPRRWRRTWHEEQARWKPPARPRKPPPGPWNRAFATSAAVRGRSMSWGSGPLCHKIGLLVKLLRMKPGFGEVLLAEGDPEVREEEELLVQEFRRQLDEGMWAAVPTTDPASGRREAVMVQDYADVPRDAERVIFFPRAAGG